MATFVALLRAINVGGTARLPMKDLQIACEAAGLRGVATYIASGNLVFTSDRSSAGVRMRLTGLLRERFGLGQNHALIRTPGDLARVIAGNPFGEAASKRPHLLMVAFLDGSPVSTAADSLRAYPGPERRHLDGRHLYVDYVDGVARSKLTPALLTRMLGVPVTSRNWNTTTKLLAMALDREG